MNKEYCTQNTIISGSDNEVIAAIVTYNPDIPLLKENISALRNQVAELLIFDNASTNFPEISSLISDHTNTHLIKNKDNLGLPVNYNRAVEAAKDGGYKWLLIMDQDTVIPENTISIFNQYTDMTDVAIISPSVCVMNADEKKNNKRITTDEDFTFIDKCISSASLNRVDVLLELNGFDEKLFIDNVDFDYCKRVIDRGYKILRANRCIIRHRLGNVTHAHFLLKKIQISNYPPIRYYYIFRNNTYFSRKYNTSLSGRFKTKKELMIKFVKIFYEKQTVKKIKMAIKGISKGRKM